VQADGKYRRELKVIVHSPEWQDQCFLLPVGISPAKCVFMTDGQTKLMEWPEFFRCTIVLLAPCKQRNEQRDHDQYIFSLLYHDVTMMKVCRLEGYFIPIDRDYGGRLDPVERLLL
jgi:hypothetical protein